MYEINNKIQAASHSGAKLRVENVNNEYMVIKTITQSIPRNYEAILKQQQFLSLPTPTYTISSIPVKNVQKDDSRLLVSMPYIEGLGGEQIAYKGSKAVAKNLKQALNFYIINSISESIDGTYPISGVINKISDIKLKLEGKWVQFPNLKRYIQEYEAYCVSDLKLPLGTCHGDLTLSNIKVTEDNRLMLFDFLECEINSPLQDAAKLIQDFEYGWSFRKEKESARIKGDIFCEFAKPTFLSTLKRLYPYEMKVIEMLTLLRIAPYIQEHDTITIEWFNRVITQSIKKITG
ncbi:phosphotransferase family protein [Vibrio paucivorans]|uniref:Phosphotransferase n=1 Tax=Vibrio paucivorans TaxID=2829489 RepID=A0A9X3HRS0_9VIBR|nr:phosphotransferase [Vibrio paucivorans]MCW8333627.1 phosphotransferase [Vibrio paucivorans]